MKDSNESKTKTKGNKRDTNTEQVELIKKSPSHWEIVLNRLKKSNPITRPMAERIIKIFDQATQDKQLILLPMTGKKICYSDGTE